MFNLLKVCFNLDKGSRYMRPYFLLIYLQRVDPSTVRHLRLHSAFFILSPFWLSASIPLMFNLPSNTQPPCSLDGQPSTCSSTYQCLQAQPCTSLPKLLAGCAKDDPRFDECNYRLIFIKIHIIPEGYEKLMSKL